MNQKKVVKITESALVDLIDNIVTEAVTIKKKEWISEQENTKTSLLETKLGELEAKIAKLTEGK